jgi:hypothetical protein
VFLFGGVCEIGGRIWIVITPSSTPPTTGYKTRQNIADEYNISTKILKMKLEAKGLELPKGRVSLRWQKRIYETLGYPRCISKHDYENI